MAQALSTPLSPSSPSSSLRPKEVVVLLAQYTSARHLSQIHGAVLRANIHQHTVVNFGLQKSYTNLGLLEKALALFRETEDPNVFFWTNVIHAHAYYGLHDTALALFSEMLFSGSATPNTFTLSSTLKACHRLQLGKIVHGYAVKQSLQEDSYVLTSLLDMYARGGEVDSARYLFDGMPERRLVSTTAMITCYAKRGDLNNARNLFDETPDKDSVCWNAMMDGYTQHGKPNEAIQLFHAMLKSNSKPNEVTVISVLSALAQTGCDFSGKWVHSFIKNKRNGIKMNAKVGNALIDMYYKCGSLEDACLVFDKMPVKDVVVWNSMIAGCSMHGESQKALELFDELLERGLYPTDITFIGVLSACSHAGLVGKGLKLFTSMENDYKIEPKIEHYGCIVDLLGRTGLIEEAYETIKKMKKIKPDSVMWDSLLTSCRLHNNMSLVENIANYLVANNLANWSTCVLLSNIYASVGNLEHVNKIRQLMKLNEVQQEVGCSGIQIGSKVFEFVIGDKSHPNSEEIYKKLDELNGLIKLHGYVPNMDLVLLDLEKEKERALAVHSERLAVSFGLIRTKPGSGIKIVNNSRVCLDCHNALKLIAKVTDRKIVVRDRNRFHYFSEGKCSCGDYW